MASVKQLLVFMLSLVAFAYTFYVVGSLMFFLSRPRNVPKIYVWVFNLLDNKSRLETSYGPMLFDTLYIIGFILQHSCMKSDLVKSILDKVGLAAAERSIYCLTSSLSLHYLIRHWLPAQSIVLWQVDVASSYVLWWTFSLVHGFAWMIIYGGSIIMDLPEILGVKQAYYDLKDYAQPIAYKSFRLRHLYSHVRHPSFVGLSVILWATNLMTIDRFLLALLLTTYMFLAWSTDRNDVVYQRNQFQRKVQELKND
ncbi:PREDICTED: nurim homolog [Rhagoletis zephyria]|uniref:nurim homolog n=1 Tax=Rhagoletis zephyria TaxID=28612 RepID=UPI0008114E91|nr:PREDICTED: nurim homolog [Rhagoletis zephyria]